MHKRTVIGGLYSVPVDFNSGAYSVGIILIKHRTAGAPAEEALKKRVICFKRNRYEG